MSLKAEQDAATHLDLETFDAGAVDKEVADEQVQLRRTCLHWLPSQCMMVVSALICFGADQLQLSKVLAVQLVWA